MTKIAKAVAVTGTFTGTGQSSAFLPFPGSFSVTLSSGVATVKLERSADTGASWIDVSSDALGTVASWTLNSTEVAVVVDEPEAGCQFRLNCTAFTSGTVTYRLGQ